MVLILQYSITSFSLFYTHFFSPHIPSGLVVVTSFLVPCFPFFCDNWCGALCSLGSRMFEVLACEYPVTQSPTQCHENLQPKIHTSRGCSFVGLRGCWWSYRLALTNNRKTKICKEAHSTKLCGMASTLRLRTAISTRAVVTIDSSCAPR